MVGGSPLRVLRLGESAAALFDEWDAGREVGPSPPEGRFARRLVDAGIAHPRPPERPDADVTFVIPVRDRQDGLRSTLSALAKLSRHRIVVVDDGSARPVTLEPDGLIDALVIRMERTGGPAAARNAGWRTTDSEIVVFLDADCIPVDGWLEILLRHFADPEVAAVAPRILSDESPGSTLAVYESTRSSLDLGKREAAVRPRSRVPYVPTACLAVRRRALIESGGFNEELRFGEDVDLVWRLHRAGWTVRYDPSASVAHPPRSSIPGWLRQRFDYGRSAASLAELHGRDVAPLDISPWSAGVWALVVAGHPVAAAMLLAGSSAALARRAGRDRATGAELLRLAARGNFVAGTRIAEAVRRTWLPPVLLFTAMVPSHRARGRILAAVAAALALPLGEWIQQRPPLNAPTWTAFRLADDLAYQGGLWFGVVKERSLKAVLPRL